MEPAWHYHNPKEEGAPIAASDYKEVKGTREMTSICGEEDQKSIDTTCTLTLSSENRSQYSNSDYDGYSM